MLTLTRKVLMPMILLSAVTMTANLPKTLSSWEIYNDQQFGFKIDVPSSWEIYPAWETGQSMITALRGPTMQVFVIVENRPSGMGIHNWLVGRDQALIGKTLTETTFLINQRPMLRREFEGWEQHAISIYGYTDNKFYELNIQSVTTDNISLVERLITSLTLYNTDAIVPVLSSVSALENTSSNGVLFPASAPDLHFPFPCCDVWKISCGYIDDPVCQHPSDQYNRYGLDIVRDGGETDGQSVVAAHGGLVRNGWDSTGGGNIVKIAADGNFNGYVTFYAHLKTFSQTDGAWVNQGNEIAIADCTGSLCFGSHLHFAYWLNYQSIKPEPMSGYSGFQTGQTFIADPLSGMDSNAWDFRNGPQGWVAGNGLSDQRQEPQGLWFNVSANDPFLNGPMINASATSYPYLYLKMASETDHCGQIYFKRHGDADFSETRKVDLSIVANGADNIFIFDMRNNPNWTGNIIQLRLDPACNAVNNHAVRIDQLALLSNVKSWDFRNGPQGWVVGNGLSDQRQEPQGLWFNVSATDPFLNGPMINAPAANYPYLYLKMASETDHCGQIYFKRHGDADFSEGRKVDLPIVANGADNVFIFDMRNNPNWIGNIIQLRLDPACSAVNNHAVRIDQLALLSNAKSWDFRNGLQGWVAGNGLGDQRQEPQGLWFNVSANDPFLNGPMINAPATSYPYLYLKMASETDHCGQIYFKRHGDADFSETRKVDLPIVANGADNIFIFDMRNNPNWTGNIIQLRLDPACNAVNNHAVRIDEIALKTITSTPTPTKTSTPKPTNTPARTKTSTPKPTNTSTPTGGPIEKRVYLPLVIQ